MDFTFLKNGSVAFYRSDAEQADWTQEEMSLFCTFPYVSKKVIERGMTVLFRDPATNTFQAYEIRNCTMFPGESYQQFTAEDIAISELSDIHIQNDMELTNITAKAAFDKVLPGTGWQIGTDGSSGRSSADIGRGSVWEGITTIRSNWNVQIQTRITVNSTGIAKRYIDILPPDGTWRGFRLAIDKNCSDPCVTYDDSELYTALYAYGASYTDGTSIDDQKTVETNISGVSWSKTSSHPAKPAGQKYLEWPEKTKLYGRNGKPRYGYYQNTNIKSASLLLQKTWEALKACSDPKISVTGTVADFRRMGYKDEPIRLYDMAICDLGDVRFYKQIIALTVDLINPDKNRPTVGDYIPNIVYINRETNDYATGGSTGTSGGRGGGKGGSRSQKKQGEFETSILQNERNIILEARQVDENRNKLKAAGIEIDPITGVVIYAEDVKNGIGANFKVTNNAISSEVSDRKSEDNKLQSKITQTANSISLEVSERKNADSALSSRITVNAGNINLKVSKDRIISSINVSPESIDISASRINLTGYVTATELATIQAEIRNLTTGVTTASFMKAFSLNVENSFILFGHYLTYWEVKTPGGTTINVPGYYGGG